MKEGDAYKKYLVDFSKTCKRVIGEISGIFSSSWDIVKDFGYLAGHFLDSSFKTKNYNSLAKFNTAYFNENNNLRSEIGCLNERVDDLANKVKEQKNKIKKCEELESKCGKLERRNSELENLCGQQNRVMHRLQRSYKKVCENCIIEHEKFIIERAKEGDAKLSYVVIKGLDKILVATPEFENKFYFNNDEIKGKSYFKVLKDSINSKFVKGMKKFFVTPEEVDYETIIVDGKNKERVIHFVKYKPEAMITLQPDISGKLAEQSTFYTRVDVHDVGILKRTKEGVLKKFYHSYKVPGRLQEFIEQECIKDTLLKNEEMGEISKKLIEQGMEAKKIIKLWDNSNGDEEKFRESGAEE